MISTTRFIRVKQLILRVHAFLFVLILMSMVLPATAWAQVSFTGSATAGNFGAQAIGSPSAPVTLNFTVSSGTTVGSVGVVTTGIANLDFANAAGSTCTAKVYSSTTACTVKVTFTPTAAGLRMGAVMFFSKASNAGTVLGSVALYGTGMGAQVAYGPGALLVVDAAAFNGRLNAAGLQNPHGLTADAGGNLFILDDDSTPVAYRLVKVPASGAAPTASDPTVNGEALYLPSCVAVDGAGDVFIGDFFGRVVKVPAGGGVATAITPSANGIPMNYPSALAVDGAGDLFIADFMNNRVLEVPASGGAALAIDPTVNGTALIVPRGVAVDAAGDLFIADMVNDRVVEIPAGGGAAKAIGPNVDGIELENPTGIAVDAAGDLFVSDGMNHRVVELSASGGAAVSIDEPLYDQGLGEVYSVALDSGGDVFVIEGGLEGSSNIVEELERSKPATLSFSTLTAVGSTDSTDGAKTEQILNIGNQPLTLTALNYPTDFPEAAGDANACSEGSVVNPGSGCDVSAEFSPSNGGALNEGVTLTDNAMNAAGSQQSIPVSATAELLAALTSPGPGSLLPGPSTTFSWTTNPSATRYALSVGSTGPGSSDLLLIGKVLLTSFGANGLPSNGKPVYVRLFTYFGTVQFYRDYVFTAVTPSSIASPVSSSVFPGSSATFTWAPSPNATGYALWMGTSGPGSSNLFYNQENSATAVTVSNLPAKGAPVYVRLFTYFGTAVTHTDSVYTEASPAALTSPAPGGVLAGASATFGWNSVAGATGYSIAIGSSGVGSNNVKATAESTAISAALTGLPTNSETLYVRLFTYFNSITSYNDYTYTACAPGTPATMITPSQGSTLGASNVKFTWTAGTGATEYDLWLGLSGPGASSLYVSGWVTTTSTTAPTIPAKGATVYVRLYSMVNGTQEYIDYTYIEP